MSRRLMGMFKTVALGYSKFCELFTEDEWEGFNYASVSVFFSDGRVLMFGVIQFGSPFLV